MSLRHLGRICRFEEIDSTNRYLADEARAGAPSGLVAVASHQTAGRGRLGRRWEAPPRTNLLMSVLLRPAAVLLRPAANDDWAASSHALTIAFALGAADACRQVASVDPGLKWPNDLVVDDLKLAGILAEAVLPPTGVAVAPDSRLSGGPAVVVGLGLNANWPSRADAETAPTPDQPLRATSLGATSLGATSLARLSGAPVDIDLLLTVVLEHLDRRISDLIGPPTSDSSRLDLTGQTEAQKQQMTEYRSRCATLGRAVRVEEIGGTFTAEAIDITDEGHLVVATSAGRRVVTTADVVHLRHDAR